MYQNQKKILTPLPEQFEAGYKTGST